MYSVHSQPPLLSHGPPTPIEGFIFATHTPFYFYDFLFCFLLFCYPVSFTSVPYWNMNDGLYLQPLRGGGYTAEKKCLPHPRYLASLHLSLSSLLVWTHRLYKASGLHLAVTVTHCFWGALSFPMCTRTTWEARLNVLTGLAAEVSSFPQGPPHTPLFPIPEQLLQFVYLF